MGLSPDKAYDGLLLAVGAAVPVVSRLLLNALGVPVRKVLSQCLHPAQAEDIRVTLRSQQDVQALADSLAGDGNLEIRIRVEVGGTVVQPSWVLLSEEAMLGRHTRGDLQSLEVAAGRDLPIVVLRRPRNSITSELHTKRWQEALEILGWSRRKAFMICSARLVLWHLSQPLVYMFAFYACSQRLDEAQRILATIVLVRESFYVVLCIVCTIQWPSFLLYDIVVDGVVDLIEGVLFVLAPEKFIVLTLFQMWIFRPDRVAYYFQLMILLVITVVDLCSIAAFILALVRGTWCAPLLIGYSVTAVAGLLVVAYILWQPVAECCFLLRNRCCWRRRADFASSSAISDARSIIA